MTLIPNLIASSAVPEQGLDTLVSDFLRCAPEVTCTANAEIAAKRPGYFRFGPSNCFGRFADTEADYPRSGILSEARAEMLDERVSLPFSPAEVVANLRDERYLPSGADRSMLCRLYYCVRPFLPNSLRGRLQRYWLSDWPDIKFPQWPVDTSVEQIVRTTLAAVMRASGRDVVPFVWFWPDGHRSCIVLTHDVETQAGRDLCPALMDIDDEYGIKAAFQLIPEERYEVPQSLLDEIRRRDFEINVHDLNHDGALFREHEEFKRRAERINRYGRVWHAKGFRAAALYHRQDWFGELDFEYDMSVPNVGHIEAQRGGCCTVFPYFVADMLELPLTTTQDYAMFKYLREYSTRLWRWQIELIRREFGLISLLAHPDYIMGKRERAVYAEILEYVAELRSRGDAWVAKPAEVNEWWRARSQMHVVQRNGTWKVEGPQSERACCGVARLIGEQVVYEIPKPEPVLRPVRRDSGYAD